MIVYGRNPVREALRGRRRVLRLWATDPVGAAKWVDAASGDDAVIAVERAASSEELTERCGAADHQGVCAETEDFTYADAESLLAADDALVVCLDQVQDPHNLGAVCRVAECAGAAGVVIPRRRAAAVTSAVCRTSAGAVEHLPVATVRNLADFLERAKGLGAWTYGAAAEAGVRWDALEYGGRVVLVLGAEDSGLRPRVAAACDELVALPIRGRLTSLNVSTAAAALVYGILHLRGQVDKSA